MNTSYEHRIVEAMLRRSEALAQGDDNAAAAALVEAGNAATALRTRRGESRAERERRDTLDELEAVKP